MEPTQEEKRIKIAEACGWTVVTSDGVGRPPWSDRCGADDCSIPDYYNNLAAMHGAEQWAYRWFWHGWASVYDELLKHETSKTHDALIYNWSWHAPAKCRAEAFYKSLGHKPPAGAGVDTGAPSKEEE